MNTFPVLWLKSPGHCLSKRNLICNYCFKKYSFHFSSSEACASLFFPSELPCRIARNLEKQNKNSFWHFKLLGLDVRKNWRWMDRKPVLFQNYYYYHCPACFVPNPQSPQAFWGFIQETQHAQGREENLVRHNSTLLFSPPTPPPSFPPKPPSCSCEHILTHCFLLCWSDIAEVGRGRQLYLCGPGRTRH